MHSKVTALFAENEAPTHCRRDEVLDLARPLLQLAARVRQQAGAYRELLTEAELSVDLPDALRSKLEYLHQTVGATERIANELTDKGRELVRVTVQMDTVLGQAKHDLETWEASEGKKHGAPTV